VRSVKIQNIIQLAIELSFISPDCAVYLISHTCLDMMVWVGGIPLELAVTFPSVTVLKILGLALSSETGAEQIPIVKLLTGVLCLTFPMLDLHCGRPIINPTHAVTA
jgi:hypothetical protein